MSATEQQPSVAEVLNLAADLIEPEGAWTQGEYARGASGRRVTTLRAAKCFCIIGAIDAAQGHNPGTESSINIVAVVRRTLELDHASDVADWNDDPSRTQAEVVTALRQAAALTPRPIGEGK